ncbi:hypothetical protein IH981_04190 [Patescibacteria group bacterium]|nr:hypothetical protein [Patescibacteria group bacterium]
MRIFQKRISYKAAGAIVFVILLFTLGTIYLMLSARGDQEGKATSTTTPAATKSAIPQEATSSADTPEEESPSIPLSPSSNVVTITTSGFSPSSITINAGETVTWVNNDTKNHWPASDKHPVHLDYPGPGFDSLGIGPGDSWSFQFGIRGPWGYHDHNIPARTGIVVVQ